VKTIDVDAVIDLPLDVYEPTCADRCDSGQCGAHARVLTTLPNGLTLQWCGHHYRACETGLAAKGATVLFAEPLT
jgi:hypothetical protein